MIDANQIKPIRFKTSMLRSGLCDFSDVYIVVKGEITVARERNSSKKYTLKNNAPFIGCILQLRIF